MPYWGVNSARTRTLCLPRTATEYGWEVNTKFSTSASVQSGLPPGAMLARSLEARA